jgi:hypothetical protein
LELKSAFILGDAMNGLPGAEADRNGRVGRRTAGIAKRLFDLGRSPFSSDIRKVGAQDTAAPSHHVAIRAVSLPREQSLAGGNIARLGAGVQQSNTGTNCEQKNPLHKKAEFIAERARLRMHSSLRAYNSSSARTLLLCGAKLVWYLP